ncbi:MAG: RimK family alpha-L-glutamate ligase [Anaerolineae bacterium]|nr:RimK family alpha-L-glutamate ligase [Anaerolineae bacterium]
MSGDPNKPRIAILGSSGTWHSRQLTAAFLRRGITPTFADPTRLASHLGGATKVQVGAIALSECDLLLVRDVPGGSLEQVIFRMDALHQLENSGVRVVNSPHAIEKMVDKYYTLSLLQGAGLPVPESRVCENNSDARTAFHDLGGDVVIKPLFGSRGKGMVRVTDPETAQRVFTALQMGGYIYYLQRFIPHDNRDTRVMVMGGECVAAMERVARGWKTNIAAGGTPTPTELTDETRTLCLQAAQALGADYCGVDLLRNPSNQLFLIEANSIPAWRGLQQVTNENIADKLVAHCLRLI